MSNWYYSICILNKSCVKLNIIYISTNWDIKHIIQTWEIEKMLRTAKSTACFTPYYGFIFSEAIYFKVGYTAGHFVHFKNN